MSLYKKDGKLIDAFQWTGDHTQTEDPKWIVEAIKAKKVWFERTPGRPDGAQLSTGSGTANIRADRYDYVAKDLDTGEIFFIRASEFCFAYEPVNNS